MIKGYLTVNDVIQNNKLEIEKLLKIKESYPDAKQVILHDSKTENDVRYCWTSNLIIDQIVGFDTEILNGYVVPYALLPVYYGRIYDRKYISGDSHSISVKEFAQMFFHNEAKEMVKKILFNRSE